jgi:uncharacterized protein YndB with AHSA1/START domain
MNDSIEKQIELKAPVSRVWRALTDYREFGEWFRVKLDGPFVPGQLSRGRITHPGYEHIRWEATVRKMEPERLFFVYLAPVCDRSRGRLLARADDLGRVQARAEERRHRSCSAGIRI